MSFLSSDSFLAGSSQTTHKLHKLHKLTVQGAPSSSRGRSQWTFADSSIFLSSLHTFLQGSVLCSAHALHLSIPQNAMLFHVSKTFHMLLLSLPRIFFFLLQAQLRCYLSQVKLVLQPLFSHGTWPATVVITTYCEECYLFKYP